MSSSVLVLGSSRPIRSRFAAAAIPRNDQPTHVLMCWVGPRRLCRHKLLKCRHHVTSRLSGLVGVIFVDRRRHQLRLHAGLDTTEVASHRLPRTLPLDPLDSTDNQLARKQVCSYTLSDQSNSPNFRVQ